MLDRQYYSCSGEQGSASSSRSILQQVRPLSSYFIHSVVEGDDDPNGLVDICKDRYDLTTFSGRVAHFRSVTSPLTLLASSQELVEAQRYVKEVESHFPQDRRRGSYFVTMAEAKRYWKARQLVDSSVHPDTGMPIPLPFRMSAFVPTNLLVVGGMLLPNPSLSAVIFWQWVNQSLNVAVNYSNANKSVPMSMQEVGIAYGAATTSAVGIAVGLSRLVPRLKSLSPNSRLLLGRFIPFISVATAGCVNIGCMRWKEMSDGVTVFRRREEDGTKVDVGTSATAGKMAVGMTAASRVMTNVPVLVLPPLLMAFLQNRRLVPQTGLWARATELTLIGSSLFFALPPAIAYFPQTASVPAAALEGRFRGLKDEQGREVTTLEFNKGL